MTIPFLNKEIDTGNLKEKLIVVGFGLLAGVVVMVILNGFFDKYRFRFQSPIILQAPVILEQRKPVVVEVIKEIEKPVASPSAKPQSYLPKINSVYAEEPDAKTQVLARANGETLWKVYGLESSWGVNDSCKNKGMFNGFGYIPGNCYDHFSDVLDRVERWFVEKLAEHDLPTAICGYNLGFGSEHMKACLHQSSDYPYYKNYLSL